MPARRCTCCLTSKSSVSLKKVVGNTDIYLRVVPASSPCIANTATCKAGLGVVLIRVLPILRNCVHFIRDGLSAGLRMSCLK